MTEPDKYSLLQQWNMVASKLEEIKAELKPIQEEERALRDQVALAFFGNSKKKTNYEDIGNGWRLKAVLGERIKFDEAAMPAVFKALEEAKVNTLGLIRWKAEVGVKAVKALTPEQREIMDECLIYTPEAPVLELLPPKENDA